MKTGKTKIIMLVGLMATFVSCKSPMERWLNNMVDFKETKSQSLTLQAARINTDTDDTTQLSYKVRIYLNGASAQNGGYDQSLNLYYHMDSCFHVRVKGYGDTPVIVQPVNNGISGCYEYLLSLDVKKKIRFKRLQLIYQDKFIDGKQYQINLN